eukprot:6007303-Prymnesium_polylepis.2
MALMATLVCRRSRVRSCCVDASPSSAQPGVTPTFGVVILAMPSGRQAPRQGAHVRAAARGHGHAGQRRTRESRIQRGAVEGCGVWSVEGVEL